MRPETGEWKRVEPYLDQALSLEGGAREEWLCALSREQPVVASDLRRLLRDQEVIQAEGFLEYAPLGPAAPGATMPLGLEGQTVGAYTLKQPLGDGGMGSVWLAERSDGRFERRAAVKFLNLALVGRADERFRREGRILAQLTHPHIAQLLDGGVSPAGHPYLVLEHVDGQPIDRYCDEHRLDTRQRVRLYLGVLAAVQHAHAHLVVHRDLKPSNVLVTADGRVKLLDFGIAKLLADDESSAGRTATHTGLLMTPAYAAPEQVTGQSISTATDIYALGVLLFVLLTGRHPAGDHIHSTADLMRAIVERDPPLLSSATRGPSRRALAGDLETIVATALKKRPAERYASASAFADDLQRYLTHQPIAARADRWGYRAVKFVRRHTVGVAATLVVVAALSAAVVIARGQQFEAERQRDRAAIQARRAQASSEFMRFLVTQIGKQPMTMKEVLDRGRQALDQQYGRDPAFQARMLIQLSGPYIDLGDYETSAAMMTRALSLATTLDDADLLSAAHCSTGVDLVEQRQFDTARFHFSEGRRQAERQGDAGRLPGECATGETRLALAEGRYEEAVHFARLAVDAQEKAGGPATTALTSALNNLATAYNGTWQLREAVEVSRRAVAISRDIGRGRTSGVVVSLNNEGGYLRRLGRWLESDRVFREAIDLARDLDTSGQAPGYLLVNYAALLDALGRSDAAMTLIEQARRTTLPPAFVAVAKLTEASMRLERGDVAGARALQVTLETERLPSFTTHIPTVRLLGARILRGEGRLTEARQMIRDVIADEGYPARTTGRLPDLLEHAARFALEAGELQDAVETAREAVRIADLEIGTGAPSAITGRARMTLGLALAASADPQGARDQWSRAASLLEAAAGATHHLTRDARTRLAATDAR